VEREDSKTEAETDSKIGAKTPHPNPSPRERELKELSEDKSE
jgi:hypothetical protein